MCQVTGRDPAAQGHRRLGPTLSQQLAEAMAGAVRGLEEISSSRGRAQMDGRFGGAKSLLQPRSDRW